MYFPFPRPRRLLFLRWVALVVVVLGSLLCRLVCPANQRTRFPHFTALSYLLLSPRTKQAPQSAIIVIAEPATESACALLDVIAPRWQQEQV